MTTAGAFDFGTAGRIVFGPGRAAELPSLIDGWGTRALVCTGADPERHRRLLDVLPVPVEVFPVVGEPTVEMAGIATDAARAAGADLVIAIGGGSVLDLGKSVAMLLGNGGQPLDYLEVIGRGLSITEPSATFVAIPTTAGTGSEVTANAVLASPDHGRKASVRSASELPPESGPGTKISVPLSAKLNCDAPEVPPEFRTPSTTGVAPPMTFS